MSKIKSRKKRKGIKTLDNATIAGERMKDAYLRSKDTAARLEDDNQGSPGEYAGDQVQRAVKEVARDAGYVAVEQGRKLAVKGHEAAKERASAWARSDEAQEYPTRHFFGTTSEEPPPHNDTPDRHGSLYGRQSTQARVSDPENGPKARDRTIGREPVIRTRDTPLPSEEPRPEERGRGLAVQRARSNAKEAQLDQSRYRGEIRDSPQKGSSSAQKEAASLEQGRQAVVQQRTIKTKETQQDRSRIRRAPEPPTEDTPSQQIRSDAVERGRQYAVNQRKIKAKEIQQDRMRFQEEQRNPQTSDTPSEQITVRQGSIQAGEIRHDRDHPRPHNSEYPAMKSPSVQEQEHPIWPARASTKAMPQEQGHPSVFSERGQPADRLPAKAEQSPVEKGRQLAINQAKVRAKENRLERAKAEAPPPAYMPSGISGTGASYPMSPDLPVKEAVPNKIKTREVVRTVRQKERGIKKPTGITARDISKVSLSPHKLRQKPIKAAGHTSKQAEKKARASGAAARRSAQTAAIKAQRSAQASRAAGRAATVTAKAVSKAAVNTAKALAAAGRSLAAMIAAGGSIGLVVIVFILLIALLAGSCFGVVFATEDSGTGLTMQSAVTQINEDLTSRIEKIKEDHEGEYDKVDLVNADTITNWPDVIAIYAVKLTTGSESPEEVATMTQKKIERLREICWDMNPLSSKLVEGEESTVLQITMTPKSYTDMMDAYDFTEDQRKMVKDLIDSGLLDKYKNLSPSGGFVDDGSFTAIEGTGGYIWPLQGYTRTSSPFGYRICPFHGRELHGGVDIPAPYGTAVHAAKSGTVVLSRYGSSYGNYIVLAHGDGTRTLYAHMSARLVSPGQTVSQGQTIGRVGSTGSSTGNHLHFETWTGSNSSTRVNPMLYF